MYKSVTEWEFVGTPEIFRRSVYKGKVELMFLGRIENTIDEKGRITFPMRIRELFPNGAFITNGFDQNLMILSSERWQILSQMVGKYSLTDPDARKLKRHLFSLAGEINLDNVGRFIIPVELRKVAHLTTSAVYVSAGNDIELWSPELLLEQDKEMENPELQAKRFAAFDLSI